MPEPVPFRGFEAFVGAGQETVWGTPVARINFLRLLDWSPKRTIDRPRRPHLGTSGATSTNVRSHFTASDNAGGTFVTEASYDDSTQLLMAHALGANVTAGAGPFTHTQTIAIPRSLGAIEGLTLEGGLGTGDGEVFEGCLFDTMEFSISAGGIATITYGMMAETSGGLVVKTAFIASPGGEPIRHDHAGLFTFNGNTFALTDLTVTITKNLTRRLLLGSVLTNEPTSNDFAEVAVRFTVEYGQQAGLNADWLADTSGDATILFTGAGNNSLALTLQNMFIMDISRPINTAGVITQTVEARCESDGTDEGLEFLWTNDNTLFTDN